jgi:hypothetical protein
MDKTVTFELNDQQQAIMFGLLNKKRVELIELHNAELKRMGHVNEFVERRLLMIIDMLEQFEDNAKINLKEVD